MIYVGYQGVGKSSIRYNNNIDLESSNFFTEGHRPATWVDIYVNIAESLDKQGYDVFLSSHKSVRDELHSRGIPFVAIYPSLKLKDKWIKRLNKRYESYKSDKNYKALINAMEMYEVNITDLMQEPYGIEITKIRYDLKDYLGYYVMFDYIPYPLEHFKRGEKMKTIKEISDDYKEFFKQEGSVYLTTTSRTDESTFKVNFHGENPFGELTEIVQSRVTAEDEIERLNNKVDELMTLYTTERNVKEDYKSIIKEIRANIEDITSNHFKRYDDEIYKLCDDILEIIDKGE